ncbi:MAG: cation-transporting P-type ATPase [Acidimicrobiia bacterium]
MTVHRPRCGQLVPRTRVAQTTRSRRRACPNGFRDREITPEVRAVPGRARREPGAVVARHRRPRRRTIRGVDERRVADRLRRIGPNRLAPQAPVPAWRKLLAQFVDPLVYLLVVAAAVSLVNWATEGTEGVPFEAFVIVAVLLANGVLGYRAGGHG